MNRPDPLALSFWKACQPPRAGPAMPTRSFVLCAVLLGLAALLRTVGQFEGRPGPALAHRACQPSSAPGRRETRLAPVAFEAAARTRNAARIAVRDSRSSPYESCVTPGASPLRRMRPHDAALPLRYDFRVRTVLPTGEPVAGVDVALELGGCRPRPASFRLRTDGRGEAHLSRAGSDFAPGAELGETSDVLVRVVDGRFADSVTRMRMRRSQAEQDCGDLVLYERITITGRVRGLVGSRWQVYALAAAPGITRIVAERPNADGAFTLAGVARSARVEVSLYHPQLGVVQTAESSALGDFTCDELTFAGGDPDSSFVAVVQLSPERRDAWLAIEGLELETDRTVNGAWTTLILQDVPPGLHDVVLRDMAGDLEHIRAVRAGQRRGQTRW